MLPKQRQTPFEKGLRTWKSRTSVSLFVLSFSFFDTNTLFLSFFTQKRERGGTDDWVSRSSWIYWKGTKGYECGCKVQVENSRRYKISFCLSVRFSVRNLTYARSGKVVKRSIKKDCFVVLFQPDSPTTLYMQYFYDNKDCWAGPMDSKESELYVVFRSSCRCVWEYQFTHTVDLDAVTLDRRVRSP